MKNDILKIDFLNFWKNFNKYDNYFLHLLKQNYKIKVDNKDPDLIFDTTSFTNHKLEVPKKNSIKKIFFSGEPDYEIDSDYDAIIASVQKSKNIDFIYMPLFVTYIDWFNIGVDKFRDPSYLVLRKNLIKSKKNIKPNSKDCSMLASKDLGIRKKTFIELNNFIQIDSGGLLENNIKNIIKGRGDQKYKLKFLKKYKFNLCFENSKVDNYISEKILHSIASNSIPIYWGTEYVKTIFNENSFVYVDNFNSTFELKEYILNLLNDENLYKLKLSEPWFKNNIIPPELEPSNYLNFIEKNIK